METVYERPKVKRRFRLTLPKPKVITTRTPYVKRVLSEVKTRQKKRFGKKCDLTLEFLIDLLNKQRHRCALLNTQVTFLRRNKRDTHANPMNASLDRIDNTKDYSPDNVQWLSWMGQCMKNEYPQGLVKKVLKKKMGV